MAATLVSGVVSGVVGANELKDFESHIKPFLAEHCYSCHGNKKQKADFTVHEIDGLITNGKDAVHWEKILEMISLGDMPPEDEAQPSKLDRSKVKGVDLSRAS